VADHPLRAAAEAILPDVIEIRRRLHRRPEMGLHLPATQAVIADELRRLGLDPRLGGTTTSVVAVIEGSRPGPSTLLRADMDALPLGEDTGLDFASEVEGVMHACGHDTHVAMLLGAARLLVERTTDLRGRVLLMFQPGEEGFHGARFMLDEGLLEDGEHGAAGVERAVALHISTRYPSGVVALRPGAMLASADRIEGRVVGRGGHASTPHLALDPVYVAAEFVVALQSIVSRRVDAFDPAIVSITRLDGGTTNNIIPESVAFEGTIRTVSEGMRTKVGDWVRQVAAGVAATHGATIDLEIVPGYPVTMNDPGSVARFRELAVAVAGEAALDDLAAPVMGAEDFSYVLQRVPGLMAFLGARPASVDPATAPQNHSNRVVFDEAAMAVGVALYAAAALEA
jgi:amidohydrolase